MRWRPCLHCRASGTAGPRRQLHATASFQCEAQLRLKGSHELRCAKLAPVREFLLPYEAARTAADPRAAVLDFLQSTYEAAATLAHWDRAALEMP